MKKFAVIDTETNWADKVMSIGTVIAGVDNFEIIDARYHVITPEYTIGGMYYDVLFPAECRKPIVCTRADAMKDLLTWFAAHRIDSIFAYNATFDKGHMSELSRLHWYDIMRLAAYRQHNPKIPDTAPLYSTGRLKRGYGVEAMLRLLSGDYSYCETHNALFDAVDELEIMRLLGHRPEDYIEL